jgi:protein-S-isoprenylcysteine O-methyltransferase Ste14
MMGGWLLFIASLAWIRIGASKGGGESVAKKSGRSRWGVFIQMLGFFAASFGRPHIDLPAASPLALGEGAAVAALMLLSVGLFTSAARAMGANWSIVARMRDGHELVSWGVFAHLRHPIYTAMGSFMIAFAIAFGHEFSLILALPLFAIGTGIRIHEEEKLLRGEFGAAYDDYAARVKRFLPGVI